MKHLPVKNKLYQKHLENFGQWLSTLGYNPQACENFPDKIREFFHFLETQQILYFEEITQEHTKNYIDHLKTRKHIRGEGGLSATHINTHIGVLKKFASYLRPTTGIDLPPVPDYLIKEKIQERAVFSEEEIKKLYSITDESPIGMRDRAILTIYYGCGLRLSEGTNLALSDVLFERKLLYVRKAKNSYERYVPITTTGLKYLETYILHSRPLFAEEAAGESTFFLNSWGQRLGSATVYNRLINLYKKAGINKKAGTHTLRHTIATHLLQKGMELEQIALLLGHRSLDSTQVYTHIVNEIEQTQTPRI